jgi:3-oxoacyl-[acyl-carrier protein] reductase
MYINLSGFSAFVTGGSRGIGAAIVRALVESGAQVVFQYVKNSNDAQKLADTLGRGTKAIKADLASPDGPQKAFDKAIE